MNAQKFSWRYLIFAVIIGLAAYMVMDFNSRLADWRRLTDEREHARAMATEVAATKNVLEAQIAYATSEAAVQAWAYEDGHMIKPGDHPVVPVAVGAVTPTPAPTEVVEVQETSNWQRWLALFFGPITK